MIATAGKTQKATGRQPSGRLWLLLLTLILFGGCAIRPVEEQAPKQEPSSVPSSRPSANRPAVQALDRMLQEARDQFESGQWQAAIASAERGLRIDRREPELYLLLAKSYRVLAELDRARQFAMQGLRYVNDPADPIAIGLEALITALDVFQEDR